ncbi:TetR/AcrR family transcriptional regulator [Acinetobacter seifertii]|uniref:TetR/AcrR family transcriptional regulator n=1 Tax=Acinetobacter seifertii TaxID=1530123 RepID=UPI003466573E
MLKTTIQLFIQESYISVGVDRIIAKAYVTKMTFYKNFPSKEELVFVCLKELKLDIQIAGESISFRKIRTTLYLVHRLVKSKWCQRVPIS